MADHRDRRAEMFEHNLIHRAIADPTFRSELVANATAVVKRELAKVRGSLGPNVTVHVMEETPSSVYIVLPPRGHSGGSYDPYRISQN